MDASIGVTHFTSAAIVVYTINKLKAAKWFPLLQKDWTTINRAFSIGVAFLVSIGIHYVWTPGADGGHQLVLQIPSLSVLALGAWHTLNQYCMQEVVFRATKDKTSVAPQGS